MFSPSRQALDLGMGKDVQHGLIGLRHTATAWDVAQPAAMQR